MAISKQIVELMGGDIGAESEEEKGSTFWFTVTLEKNLFDNQQVSNEFAMVENMRILVVDSNSTSLNIFREYLNAFYCRVEVCDTYTSALGLLHTGVNEADPFQVVIIDYGMVDIKGAFLSHQIKSC